MQAPTELDCSFLVCCAEEGASGAGWAGDDSHSQAGTEGESTAETDAALSSAQQAQREAMLVSHNSLNDSRKRLLEVREALQQQGQEHHYGEDQQYGQDAEQEEYQQAGSGQYFDQDQQPGQHQQQIQGQRSAERQQYGDDEQAGYNQAHVQHQAHPQDQLAYDGRRQSYGHQHEQEQQDLDRSMAESDADLHTAQQAQREALQAEQESVQSSRQGLQEVREAMQQHSQTGVRPLKPQLLCVLQSGTCLAIMSVMCLFLERKVCLKDASFCVA